MQSIQTREEVALNVSQIASFGKALSALSGAITECRDEGAHPERDPAVGLILTKLHSFVERSGFDRQQAMMVCREVQAVRVQKPLLLQLAEKTLSYDTERKVAFHKEARKQIKLLGTALGYGKGDYDLRSNMGGIAVSGEITLHSDHVYVMIREGNAMLRDIMYRKCKDRKDYSGGYNNFAVLKDLTDIKGFARRVYHALNDGRMPALPDETIGMLF